jgi:RNA polymerase sigma-70 factor (ECF subfamily)
MSDADVFESHRPELLALAYRMLGELGRSEDVLQDAWLRWSRRTVQVESPRAYLATIVTRLCLTELTSARARHEALRGDRLPEPVDLRDTPLRRLESVDEVSMAFLFLLQRLSPAERAVLLLHDVFEFRHGEVAELIGRSEAGCRQLLRRAHESIATTRRTWTAPLDEHRELLDAVLNATSSGDVDALASLLADDVVLVADAGAAGASFGGARNLPGPLVGRTKVAALLARLTPREAPGIELHVRALNGEPAAVALRGGRLFATIQIAVDANAIRGIFIQADPARLVRLAS